MTHRIGLAVCALVLALSGRADECRRPAAAAPQPAGQTEPRIALVIGNASYARGALPTALNDAGLVAEALRSIGFEIVEGANLRQADMLKSFRDFIDKVQAAGPDALAFIYFSGHGLAFEGDNHLVAADANIERDGDIPIQAVRPPT